MDRAGIPVFRCKLRGCLIKRQALAKGNVAQAFRCNRGYFERQAFHGTGFFAMGSFQFNPKMTCALVMSCVVERTGCFG
jgi:hypothetical protein